ncbi:subtilase family protein [Euphorbia peplus]|nr:subtilase family protein [Euphorbia peplus]
MTPSSSKLQLHCFGLFLTLTAILFHVSANEDRKLHIVYMGSLSTKEEYAPSSQHLNLLQGVRKTSSAENLLLRSYGRSFNGFAAMLSDSEAKRLARSKEVVSVFPSITYQLQTTRSWSFMGFNETMVRNSVSESDLVIGALDSGIWPESESFSGDAFGPPPKKWKGSCKGGRNFTCNNKIIGARYYSGTDSARDDVVVAIGAFHAMDKGILICQAAGNEGPGLGSVSSAAPWILTVGARSIDRKFIDKVVLGNGLEIIGSSINTFDPNGEDFSVINGSQGKTTKCIDMLANTCMEDCLNNTLVKGKIVLCDDTSGIMEAKRAGAFGTILRDNGMYEAVPYPVPIPAAILKSDEYDAVTSYMQSSQKPIAKILKSETIIDSTAPLVADFSGRGPSRIVGDLLKPDVVAPGVDILAAFPPNLARVRHPSDKRSVEYNILYGTSMACPHAAGVAAYVKTFHPEWSPSAIRSAIMTTALPMNSTANYGAEFVLKITDN